VGTPLQAGRVKPADSIAAELRRRGVAGRQLKGRKSDEASTSRAQRRDVVEVEFWEEGRLKSKRVEVVERDVREEVDDWDDDDDDDEVGV
jgi:hypothetical protein